MDWEKDHPEQNYLPPDSQNNLTMGQSHTNDEDSVNLPNSSIDESSSIIGDNIQEEIHEQDNPEEAQQYNQGTIQENIQPINQYNHLQNPQEMEEEVNQQDSPDTYQEPNQQNYDEVNQEPNQQNYEEVNQESNQQNYEEVNQEPDQQNYEEVNQEPNPQNYEEVNQESNQQNYEEVNQEPNPQDYEEVNQESNQQDYEEVNQESYQQNYEEVNQEPNQQNYEEVNQEPDQQNYEEVNQESNQQNYEEVNQEPNQQNYEEVNQEPNQQNYEEVNQEPNQQNYEEVNQESNQQNYEEVNQEPNQQNYEEVNQEPNQQNYEEVNQEPNQQNYEEVNQEPNQNLPDNNQTLSQNSENQTPETNEQTIPENDQPPVQTATPENSQETIETASQAQVEESSVSSFPPPSTTQQPTIFAANDNILPPSTGQKAGEVQTRRFTPPKSHTIYNGVSYQQIIYAQQPLLINPINNRNNPMVTTLNHPIPPTITHLNQPALVQTIQQPFNANLAQPINLNLIQTMTQNPAQTIQNLSNISDISNISSISTLSNISNLSNMANLSNMTNLSNMANMTNLTNMSSISNISNIQLNRTLSPNSLQVPNPSIAQNIHNLQSIQNIQANNPNTLIQPVEETDSAPYPQLPSHQTIEIILEDLSQQLKQLQAELQNLERKKSLVNITVPPISSKKPEVQLQNSKGMLIPQSLVQQIQQESSERANKSHSKHFCSNKYLYNGITYLPEFMTNILHHESLTEPMFLAIVNAKAMRKDKEHKLTDEYIERRALWLKSCESLDNTHKEAHQTINEWPKEFPSISPKQREEKALPGCGKVPSMLLDPYDREVNIWYSNNGYISDPIREHEEYKNRVAWTDVEKQLFYEKYAQHPRDFKKIAAGIQSKSIKDVIEYYNIHRIELNLHALDDASRKKNGKRKVIAEGAVKK